MPPDHTHCTFNCTNNCSIIKCLLAVTHTDAGAGSKVVRPSQRPQQSNQCGNWARNEEGGTFSSPNYPKTYPANKECLYVLEGNQQHEPQPEKKAPLQVAVNVADFDIKLCQIPLMDIKGSPRNKITLVFVSVMICCYYCLLLSTMTSTFLIVNWSHMVFGLLLFKDFEQYSPLKCTDQC